MIRKKSISAKWSRAEVITCSPFLEQWVFRSAPELVRSDLHLIPAVYLGYKLLQLVHFETIR